jgi:amphi-Trp domain-containing protein
MVESAATVSMAPALQSDQGNARRSAPDHATFPESSSTLARQKARAATDERQTMKKQKIKFTEQQALATCVRQLEALLEGLKAGTLSLSQGGEKLWLRPGGAVDIELRAEQSGDRENLEIKLGWSRANLHVVSRYPEDSPPKTVRNWQGSAHDDVTLNQNPLGMRNLDAESAARYQEIYAASRSTNAEGQHHLDETRFVQSLAAAGVDAATQQELYNLALHAEADGRASLFRDEVIAALRKAS